MSCMPVSESSRVVFNNLIFHRGKAGRAVHSKTITLRWTTLTVHNISIPVRDITMKCNQNNNAECYKEFGVVRRMLSDVRLLYLVWGHASSVLLLNKSQTLNKGGGKKRPLRGSVEDRYMITSTRNRRKDSKYATYEVSQNKTQTQHAIWKIEDPRSNRLRNSLIWDSGSKI